MDIAQVHADGTSSLVRKIDIASLLSEAGLSASDLTSLAYNRHTKEVAIAVQHEDYDQNGYLVFLDAEGNYLRHVEAGVQPDMVTFSPDGRYAVSANEGEPRMGYDDGAIDPPGSITVVDLETMEAVNYGFEDYDRDEALGNDLLLKTDADLHLDLEPEYVAISADSRYAYVSLQENNGIAKFDLEKKDWAWFWGLTLKDHQEAGNELDVNRDRVYGGDGIVNPEEAYGVQLCGIQMPDGIAVAHIDGKDYILTANEGDAREWPDEDGYLNYGETDFDGQLDKELEHILPDTTDGLEDLEDTYYLLGGRSFSIWDADTLELVADSGSQMEETVARLFPEYLNANHEYKSQQIDRRSYSKGPEPETVEVLEVDGVPYAVVALERIGGFMVYDISDPANPVYKDYLNIRQFVSKEALQLQHGEDFDDEDEGPGQILAENEKGRGDIGAEGVCLVAAQDSPTGTPLILVGNEVTGTVTIAEFNTKNDTANFAYRTNLTMTPAFGDIEGHWAEDVIQANLGLGIVPDQDAFLPDQAITRAEFTVALVTRLGLTEKADSNFPDIAADAWYADALAMAKEADLIVGRDTGNFDPDATITREEAMCILARLQQIRTDEAAGDLSSLDKFTDKDQISDWAKEDVAYAVANDMVFGRTDTSLAPLGQITRAETVALLSRI